MTLDFRLNTLTLYAVLEAVFNIAWCAIWWWRSRKKKQNDHLQMRLLESFEKRFLDHERVMMTLRRENNHNQETIWCLSRGVNGLHSKLDKERHLRAAGVNG